MQILPIKSTLRVILTLYPLIMGVLTLGACSGGKTSDGNAENRVSSISDGTITISSIEDQKKQYYEGQSIILDLNPQGINANKLTYTWTVTSKDGAYPFNGQGKSKINFTAPEVTNRSSISVQVTVNAAEVKIFGNKNYRVSISILDTDPIPASFNSTLPNGFITTLPKVDQLDLSALKDGSTWMSYDYSNRSPIELNPADSFYSVNQSLTYFEYAEDGQIGIRMCGTDVVVPFDFLRSFLVSTAVCENNEQTYNYYQDPDTIRIESMCAGAIKESFEFKKISDTRLTNLTKIELTSSSGKIINQLENACFQYQENIYSLYDNSDSTTHNTSETIALTSFDISGQLDSDSMRIYGLIDDAGSTASAFLDVFFDKENYNYTYIESAALPQIFDKDAIDGHITILNLEQGKDIELRLDTTYELEDGTQETIEGSIFFQLPNIQ